MSRRGHALAVAPRRIGSGGELLPRFGFSRRVVPLTGKRSAWVSHDGLCVVSGLERAHLPGSGTPPLVGPQWLVSTSRVTGGVDARCRTTDADLDRVIAAFGLPAFDEDNHHPGLARHLWCPVDPAYQHACECKLTEVSVVDGGYVWTTETDSCRGCDYARLTGMTCPIHGGTGTG